MIKYVYCLRRHPRLTPAEFREYWGTRHADLIRGVVGALRARRYVQCHGYETPLNAAIQQSRGLGLEPFDGVTELWWDTEEDFVAAVSTPEGKAAAAYIADEANFVDFSRSCAFLTRERTVFEAPSPGSPAPGV